MDDSATLYVGDIKMVGRRPFDGAYVPFGLDGKKGVEGWYSTPKVKSTSEDRTGADGSFPRREVQYSARSVKVYFNTFGNARADHVALWKQLGDLHRTTQVVRFSDSYEDTFIRAFIEITTPSGYVGKVSRCSLIAVADDPLRYSWEEQTLTLVAGATAGGIDYPIDYPIDYGVDPGASQSYGVITNNGNASTGPVITVRTESQGGLQGGFTLIDSQGRSITYPDVVLPGVPIVIDSANRRLMVNGINKTWALSSREWFEVGRADSLGISFIPNNTVVSGSATAEVSFRSASI